jgi:uncharacterized protein YabE (DUF348 family)
MKIKNALLTSVTLFVDLTTIHVTLHFTYAGDAIQSAGPHKATNELLRAVTDATDERDICKITNKPCRVQIDDDRDVIVAIAHFLNDTWFRFH